MKRKEILAIVKKYRAQLLELNVRPQRIDENRTFGSCSKDELLSHALFHSMSIDNIDCKRQYDKFNRLFCTIQLCLSFANWYTLGGLRNTNRPK